MRQVGGVPFGRAALAGALVAGVLAWLDALTVSAGEDPRLSWPEFAALAGRSGIFLLPAFLAGVLLVWSLGTWRSAVRSKRGAAVPPPGGARALLHMVGPVAVFWIVFFGVMARADYKDRWWWKAVLWGLLAGWIARRLIRLAARGEDRPPHGSAVRYMAAGLVIVWGLMWLPQALLAGSEARRPLVPIPATDPAQPPNVLLVIIDTLRADHLGAYGYARETSPAMDRLAASGILFRDVVSPSSWTLPAVASILTSTYPGHHGADRLGAKLPRELDDLATRLREAGYRTVSFNTNPWLRRSFGFDDGFDEYYDQSRLSLRRDLAGVRLKNLVLRGLDRVRDDPERLPRAAAVTARAERWLRRNGSEPFFLYLHYMDVHAPYLPVRPFRGAFCTGHRFDVPDHELEHLFRLGKTKGEAEVLEHILERYDEDILATDSSIGRLVETLEALGLRERTHLVLTSDHGEEFYDHGGTRHSRTLYEEVVRVPLIVVPAGPRTAEGRVVESRVSTLDILPAILEMIGLSVPEGIAGVSLPRLAPSADAVRAVSQGRGDPEGSGGATLPRPIGSQLYRREWSWTALYIGTDKIIRGRPPAGDPSADTEVELYRLDTDPAERSNLASEDPQRVDGLLSRLEHQESLWGVPHEMRRPAEETIDPETLEQLRALGYVK
jgi:arylsulfatase